MTFMEIVLGALAVVIVGSILIVLYQRWKKDSPTQAMLDERRQEEEEEEETP